MKSALPRHIVWLAMISVGLFGESAHAVITVGLSENACSSPPSAVFIAGSFNDWSTTKTPLSRSDTQWKTMLALRDGRHYYKFVWRDTSGGAHWITDPANECMADDGHGGANSVLDVVGGAISTQHPGLETFEAVTPRSVRWVNVAGDFNGWRQGQYNLLKTGLTKWIARIEVQRPLTFKYIFEGYWQLYHGEKDRMVPDGYGGKNLYRGPITMVPAAQENTAEPVAASDWRALDRLEVLGKTGDYPAAVKMARKVATVNGPKSPLTFRALEIEATLHKRWGREDQAVKCWKELVARDIDSSPALRAAAELTAHYIYGERKYEEARTLALERLARLKDPIQRLWAEIHICEAFRWEKRYEDALAYLNSVFARTPEPDGKNNDYASVYCELWLLKAHLFDALGRRDEKRLAFEKVIQYSPWPDSQAAIMARKYLEGMRRTEQQP